MEYIDKTYKQLTGKTIEDLLESIDAHIDVLTRKPRKVIEQYVHQSPAGCQLRNIQVGEMIGLGFYVSPGSLKRFTFITPVDVKDLKLLIIRSKEADTAITSIDVKGTTCFDTALQIEANTEVFLKLEHPTKTVIDFLTAGFIFEPKGV